MKNSFITLIALILIALFYRYPDLVLGQTWNIEVITDVLTISGISMSILLPLSMNLVTRISMEYNSLFIQKYIRNHNSYKKIYLIISLVGVLLCAKLISTLSYFLELSNQNFLIIASVITYILILIFLFQFLDFFVKYSSTPEFLLDEFLSTLTQSINSVETSIKNIQKNENLFLAIREILEHQTERHNYTLVQTYSKNLESIMMNSIKTINIPPHHCSKIYMFENKVDSPDYSNLEKYMNYYTQYYIDFTIELIPKMISSSSLDLAIIHYYSLRKYLIEIAHLKHTKKPINAILNASYYLLFDVYQYDNAIRNRLAFSWYFDYLAELNYKSIDYLDLFHTHVRNSINFIISNNTDDLYHGLVRALHDNLIINSGSRKIWRLNSLLIGYDFDLYKLNNEKYNINHRIETLSLITSHCYDIDFINNTQRNVNLLYNDLIKVYPTLNNEMNKILETYTHDIVSLAKLDSIRKSTFHIIESSLYNRNYDYIFFLVNFQNPKDAEYKWAGSNRIYESPTSLLFQYAKNTFKPFTKDHRDSSTEIKQTVLLILMLQKDFFNKDISKIQFENSSLADVEKLTDYLKNNLKSAFSLINTHKECYFKLFNYDDISYENAIISLKNIIDSYISQCNTWKNNHLITSSISNSKIYELKEMLTKDLVKYVEETEHIKTTKELTNSNVLSPITFRIPKRFLIESPSIYVSNFHDMLWRKIQNHLSNILYSHLLKTNLIYKSIEDCRKLYFHSLPISSFRLLALNHPLSRQQSSYLETDNPLIFGAYNYNSSFLPMYNCVDSSSDNKSYLFEVTNEYMLFPHSELIEIQYTDLSHETDFVNFNPNADLSDQICVKIKIFLPLYFSDSPPMSVLIENL
jgi:hypothetical protein